MIADIWTAWFAALVLFVDGLLIIIYALRASRTLTTFGAALPRWYLGAVYAMIALTALPPAERIVWVRAGLLWLALAEIAHFAVYFVKRNGGNV